MPPAERVYIAVPYEQREAAKQLGAGWDREVKSWFVPPGRDPAAFARWSTGNTVSIATERDPRAQFADELRRAGFILDARHPVMDGKIHRLPVDGDKGAEKSGAYRGFLDGRPNGWHQNHKTTDQPVQWRADTTQPLTSQERAAIAAASATHKRDAAKQRDTEADIASQKAIEILSNASPATIGHAYLTAKEVSGEGLYVATLGTKVEIEGKDGVQREMDISGRLLVPIRNMKGTVISLQIIDSNGTKMFLRGGHVTGGQHVIGKPDSPWPLHIAEGYATAATIYEATGHTVVVAFTAHNLAAVAAQQHAANPDRSIFIDADNDHHLPRQLDAQGRPKRNVGLEAAVAAAAAVDGHALVPEFGPDDKGTDWNDAKRQRGMAGIQTELTAGIAIGGRRKIAREISRQRAAREAAAEQDADRSAEIELER